MAEAQIWNDGKYYEIVPTVSLAKGEVTQLKDGRAAVATSAIASGTTGTVQVADTARFFSKNSSIVVLEGDPLFWDHSANEVTYKRVNDRDFYLGTAVDDVGTTGTQIDVALNVKPTWDIDTDRDGFLHQPIGTGVLNTMGLFRRGGAHTMVLNATNEAQKLDMLSIDGWATGANAIVEIWFAVPSDGAGTVVDVSLGVANGTHATDADSITESIFFHLDANNTNINAESDDGTTEVAATDTTKDYVEGSAVANRKCLNIDMRTPTDVQLYVDKVLVLDATAFNVNAAVGPWFLLAHIEKTASTDTYELRVESMRVRYGEQ